MKKKPKVYYIYLYNRQRLMKYSFSIVLVFLSHFVYSQIVVGSVIDEQDEPLIGATVINTNSNKGEITNIMGEFVLEAYSGDYLTVSFLGKKTLAKQIPITKQDTVYMIFILKDDATKMNEFVVTGNRVKKVAGKKNESIIDYLPLLDGKIIMLKKTNKEYSLSLEEIDTVYYKTIVSFEKPHKFEQDCYGNIHLLCKDKVRQLWITDTILSLYEHSHLQYEQFLKPLLFCDENAIFTETFSNHNQKYQINRFSRFKKENQLLYEIWDKEAEKIAQGWLNEIIGFYYSSTTPEMNLIENGVWDGNVVSLQVDDPESNQMISWYLKVRAREMNIQGFANHKNIVLFDFTTNVITSLASSGKINSCIAMGNTEKVKKSTKIIFDELSNKFYFFDANKTVIRLFEINTSSGKTKEKLYLKEVPDIQNLKISDGWLYFVKKNKLGHQKLYKLWIQ